MRLLELLAGFAFHDRGLKLRQAIEVSCLQWGDQTTIDRNT